MLLVVRTLPLEGSYWTNQAAGEGAVGKGGMRTCE